MKQTRRILGIDPGLQVTGYCVLDATPEGPRVAEGGVIRSSVKRSAAELSDRLKVIYDSVTEILDQWKPQVIVVEQLYAHYEHPRTSILMAHARGVFFLCGGQRGIPVISYPSTRIKKTITGNGRASKEQMQYAIQRELHLSKLPEPHDVADAAGVALCHYFVSSSVTKNAVYTGVNLAALTGDDRDDAETMADDET